MNVSPFVAECFSDYVILVVNKEVFFYSVATGGEVRIGGTDRIAAGNKIVGPIMEVDISSNMKHLVFETPEMPKHIIWKFLDFGPARKTVSVTDMNKMRCWRRKGVGLLGRGWEEDNLYLLELVENELEKIIGKTFAIVEDRERKRIEEQLKKNDKIQPPSWEEGKVDMNDTIKHIGIHEFLGDNDLGRIEPIRLLPGNNIKALDS